MGHSLPNLYVSTIVVFVSAEIALTGHPAQSVQDAFDKSLPDHKQFNFLPKPFTLKQLVSAVKETMAS
jgi:hypothetical protein